MRSFIVSMIILGVIIAGSIFSVNYIENITDSMAEKNSQIAEALNNNDFYSAQTLVNELDKYIREKRTVLSTVIDHNCLTTIEVYVSELKQYTAGEIRHDALVKSAALDKLFEELPKNYKLNMENIL